MVEDSEQFSFEREAAEIQDDMVQSKTLTVLDTNNAKIDLTTLEGD